jgi:hypothetical protein
LSLPSNVIRCPVHEVPYLTSSNKARDFTLPVRENINGARQRTANFRKHTRNVPGIDVLATSLPPGSMTGAPKKRSCELLQGIERCKPRGIYSGVLGYLDVGGGGDFSVVIRTAYRWDSDIRHVPNGGPVTKVDLRLGRNVDPGLHHWENGDAEDDVGDIGDINDPVFEEWTVGAGGAITAQSNVNDEYDEMLTKFNSVLGAFAESFHKKAPKTWTDKQYHGYIALMELVTDLNKKFPGRMPQIKGPTEATVLELMAELHQRFPDHIRGDLVRVAAIAAHHIPVKTQTEKRENGLLG